MIWWNPITMYFREILLGISIILTIILIYFTWSWFKKGVFFSPQKKAIVIVIGIAIILSSLGIYLYKPTYSGPLQYGVQISVTGSVITDYWISGVGGEMSYWDSPPSSDHYLLWGLKVNQFEGLIIQCNGSTVFWGNHAIEINIFSSYNKTVLSYLNETGVEILTTVNQGIWDYPTVEIQIYDGQTLIIFSFNIWGPPVP